MNQLKKKTEKRPANCHILNEASYQLILEYSGIEKFVSSAI